MNKQQYVEHLRNQSSYPVYRGMINVIAIAFYVLAVVQVMMAVFSMIAMAFSNNLVAGVGAFVMGLIGAAFTALFARFWREAATIIADIGDSITEANSRTL